MVELYKIIFTYIAELDPGAWPPLAVPVELALALALVRELELELLLALQPEVVDERRRVSDCQRAGGPC
jgi:hypothetical protein